MSAWNLFSLLLLASACFLSFFLLDLLLFFLLWLFLLLWLQLRWNSLNRKCPCTLSCQSIIPIRLASRRSVLYPTCWKHWWVEIRIITRGLVHGPKKEKKEKGKFSLFQLWVALWLYLFSSKKKGVLISQQDRTKWAKLNGGASLNCTSASLSPFWREELLWL